MIIKDNFCQFCVRTNVVTPHLNLLNETVHMRGHNIWFQSEIRKIIPELLPNTPQSRATIIYLQSQCRGRSCLGTVQARSGSVQGNPQFIRSWVHCGRIHILYGHQGDILSKESSLYWAAEPCKILIQFALIVGMV